MILVTAPTQKSRACALLIFLLIQLHVHPGVCNADVLLGEGIPDAAVDEEIDVPVVLSLGPDTQGVIDGIGAVAWYLACNGSL